MAIDVFEFLMPKVMVNPKLSAFNDFSSMVCCIIGSLLQEITILSSAL